MAAAKSIRIPIWTVLLSSLLIGIPFSVFFLHLFIKAVETRRWAEMRAWCEKVARETRARDSRRPVLRGEAVPGNAWDDYEMALGSFESTTELHVVANYLYQHPKADREKARAIVDLHAPSFQALRRGASRSTAKRHNDWEGPSNPLSGRFNLFANFAACKARFLVEDDRPREAMELLLDTARFGEDVALNGGDFDGLVAMSILFIAQDELRRLLVTGKLSREDCRELARALELMDQSFPCEAEAYAIEPMPDGFYYLQMGGIAPILEALAITKPVTPTWRYGFSERLVMVDAFQEARSWALQKKDAAGKPWKEARQIQQQMEADLDQTKNPLLQRTYAITKLLSNGPPWNVFRERRAQLRLLRGLTVYRSSGEFPVLEDPYGDKIRSSMTETHIKLWSVGADGIDDGGTGDWYPRTRGKDVVLEVER